MEAWSAYVCAGSRLGDPLATVSEPLTNAVPHEAGGARAGGAEAGGAGGGGLGGSGGGLHGGGGGGLGGGGGGGPGGGGGGPGGGGAGGGGGDGVVEYTCASSHDPRAAHVPGSAAPRAR